MAREMGKEQELKPERKQEVEFSILVVCLNPGGKLKDTLESIWKQTCRNYEVILKDGLSDDGSLAYAESMRKKLPSLEVIAKKDSGIYDAMNQAASAAHGRYLYFLNCGDVFYDERVLEKMHALFLEKPVRTGIYYGNIYERRTGREVASNPQLDMFGCYRNVPCHQACFYDRRLLLAHPFDTRYVVRADYEQFLWCFFTGEIPEGISFVHTDVIITDYEGGGFSETKRNRKLSAKEHREIVEKYMPIGKVWKYRILMWITLAPFRTWAAESPATSGIYNYLKKSYYKRRKKGE